MFKFFKEKIKSWVGKSKKKIEEKAEKVEPVEPTVEEKPAEPEKKPEKPRGKKELTIDKLEKEIEEVKKEIEKVKGAPKVKKPEERSEDLEIPKEIEEAPKEREEIAKKALEEPLKDIDETFKIAEEIIEPTERTAPTIEELETEKKPSILKKLKTRFSYKLSEEDFERIFENLEMILLENNVALEAVENIKSKIKEQLIGKEIKKDALEQEIQQALKKAIENLLLEPDDLLSLIKEEKPFVIVFFGINGTGKTTTIAKVAALLKQNNISCVLAASDTFRAASIEQLEHHATKLNLKLIKHDYGADPAAVAFDAIKHAKAHNIQAVLIDTAGRMHTEGSLLSEMEKICRIADPHLKIFVAESIAGNDAIQQAKNFNKTVGIDSSILTKADVDEKGGTAISISYITKKPIQYLGTGQEYKDLQLFDPKKFIKELGL
jgi:fused signal recognition particle receptor